MNLKELFTKCFMLFSICLLGHVAVSCSDTETTDSGNFTLFFYGITDIGPSMSCELQAPSYIGGTPYDFAITNVTHEGETYTTESFTVNAETGVINIQNTNTLPTGLYSISVSCFCNGKYYEFKDAVKVNMLLAVPEGVSVTPEEVLLKMDENDWVKASAQVTTEKESHVSITQYAIAKDPSKEYMEYFTISPTTGKITIVESFANQIIAGEEYVLDLKLTTKAGEHIYPNAVTFKAISKPRNLSYSPIYAEVDEGYAHESAIPSIQGSKEELKYAIKSVNPATTVFTIDQATGKISLAENNGLEKSETPYVIDITVSNIYGSTEFTEAYSIKIVEYTAPIIPETFSYEALSLFKGEEGNQTIKEGFEGGNPYFDFDEGNSAEIQKLLNKKITIDNATGAISVSADNNLEADKTYDIHVKVTNSKPVVGTAIFKLTIKKNPNDFTFVSYGTNLEQPMPEIGSKMNLDIEEEENEANRNQFRFINRGNLPKTLSVFKNDIPSSANKTFKIAERYGKFANTTIDENNGTITLGSSPMTAYEGGILLIEVTASGNDAPSISKRIPLFFSTPKNISNQVLLYTPIVVRANPRTGVSSKTKCEVIKWASGQIFNGYEDITKLVLDYRANHTFYNFSENPNHGSGALTKDLNLLIYQVWNKYKPGSTEKDAMSYYMSTGNYDAKLAYINAADRQIIVNPDKWIGNDNEYANGAVTAQIRLNLNGTPENIESSGSQYFSVIIWLDENYEPNK